MSGVPVTSVVALVLAALCIGAATGYVLGFVDGWLNRKFLHWLRLAWAKVRR